LILSERHPEKQGLKLDEREDDLPRRKLSERHPEKQGLKLVNVRSQGTTEPFQSAIQKNKD